MRTVSRNGLGILVLAAAVALPSASALAAPTVGARPESAPSSQQGYYWRWSDGSESSTRTFTERQFGTAARLPRLVVTAVPAAPARTVVLQFRQGSRWLTEASSRTNAAGVATLALYPYCEADRWCRETIAYRLVVAGQTADLTVRYR